MNKIKSLKQLATITKDLKASHKTIGLVSGCFDLIHEGHINYIWHMRKNVDVVIVALDNDLAIKRAKGDARPLFTFPQRAKIVEELTSVNYTFQIDNNLRDFDSNIADFYHEKLTKQLNCDFLMTNPYVDKYWMNKIARSQKLKIQCIVYKHHIPISSSNLIAKLYKL
jgi:cytidyltransferase-like protein